jgi:hypothetical protein
MPIAADYRAGAHHVFTIARHHDPSFGVARGEVVEVRVQRRVDGPPVLAQPGQDEGTDRVVQPWPEIDEFHGRTAHDVPPGQISAGANARHCSKGMARGSSVSTWTQT